MKNRILSVFCAIAMIATMMNVFVATASAADAPTVTMTVVSQATETEPAEIKVEYAGIEAGREISGIQVVIPLDTTKFTYVDASATGKISYNANESALKAVFVAMPMAGVNNITETSGELGSFKLALAEGVEAGETYTLAIDNAKTYFALATTGAAEQVMATGNSVELSTGEKPAPTVPPTPEEPAMPETAYVYAKVSSQPAAAGEEVEITVSYANIEEGREISGIQAVFPIDGTKYTYVDGSATGKLSYNANESAVKAVFVAMPMAGVNNITETSGELGTFKIKLNDDLAWGENVAIAMDADKTYFALATTVAAEQVMASTVASTIVVGAGAEIDTPVDPTPTPTPPVDDEPEKVPAFETEVSTETKTVAGAKIKVFTATVAPAEGSTIEEVTALLVDSEYQVIFDGKTDKGYAAGWAIATVSADDLKAALANGTSLIDAEISIGGADEVTVSVLDSEGNTVVLAAE